MNIPKRKISETVLEFGDPMLGLLKEPTVEEFRAALSIVIVVWNAHGLSMTAASDQRVYLEKLAEYRQRVAEEGAPAIVLAGFDALDASRTTDYADDPRCVGEWDLIPDDVGGFKFKCDARLPDSHVSK